MASKKAGVSSIAGRYTTALFELADEGKLLERVESDLTHLRAVFAISVDFRRFMASPVLSREEQVRGIAAVSEAAGLSALTQRFLRVVAANRRLFVLPAMITAFLAKLAAHRNELWAEVVTAQPMSSDQQMALVATLMTMTGKHMRIDIKVDPTLLGGLVVKMGSWMVDSSLRTKLQRLQLTMKGVG